MGEKEIRPATPPTDGGPQPGTGGTQEKPGTGTPDAKQGDPAPPSQASETLYQNGFRMGTDENGNPYLVDPAGNRASWAGATGRWVSPASGAPRPGSWSGGFTPGHPGAPPSGVLR